MIRHLILVAIQNMMNISVDLLQWFTNFSIKSFQILTQLAEELHKPTIRKFIHPLRITFGFRSSRNAINK